MNTKEAIRNLDLMSVALEKVANKPENYNTDWAYYLEQMSWSLYKHANELRDLEYLFCESHQETSSLL
jgi:hypothetical protein